MVGAEPSSPKSPNAEFSDEPDDEFEEDKILSNKLQEVRKTLQQEYSNTEVITEDMVSFYLGLSKLEREVKAK